MVDKNRLTIAVIGGGPAGMMAAIQASAHGADITLFEKNSFLGKKLRITGKGRCNVTNDCTVQEFMGNVPTNPKFLWSALSAFKPSDTMAFFEEAGVPLKTERGKRVFPVSDRAGDIAGAMVRMINKSDIRTICEKIDDVTLQDDHKFKVISEKQEYIFEKVIICTGGASYPLTGSDGDGYRFSASLGHTVTEISPSLVPIVCSGHECADMQGLSLKNVALKIVDTDKNKAVYDDFGEMMFTHFGVTGPMILSASAHLADIGAKHYKGYIDLKPALDEEKLDTRVLSDFEKYSNRDFANSMTDLLPQKMIPVFVKMTGIDPQKKVNNVTKAERQTVVKLLKAFPIELIKLRPIDESIITRGGVDVRQINPKTMESKLVPGLYFAGEVIDVDAYTGGFNLQIAFSTGYTAGISAAEQE